MRSFMDLPADVRRKIYILAGLVRVCPINLNTEGGDKTEFLKECGKWFRDHMDKPFSLPAEASMRCYYRRKRFMNQMINPNADGFDCICPPLPNSLLRVSRAVHADALSVLFSENKFRICRTERNGLSPLFALNPLAYNFMTSLSIKLNSCSCVPNHECPPQLELDKTCASCHYTCRPGGDAPLSETQPGAQDVIFQWNMLVDRLTQYIQPSQLRLSVACDTLDYAAAKRISQPLLKLPTLAQCALRLNQSPDPAFCALAERAALGSTGRPSHHLDQAFRFLDLPVEIQMQILSYTDLVSECAVDWSPRRCREEPVCCHRCTDSLEFCCCALRHGAYTTASCRCWSMPSSLFLVDRKFRDYSTQIFFSRNRFKIRWDECRRSGLGITNLSEVLGTLSPAALRYIRHIEIYFFELQYYKFSSVHHFESDWANSMGFLGRKLTLANVTLLVHDASNRGQSVENLTTGRDDSLEVEEREWELYQRLVQPLVDLKQPFKDFSITFSRPPYGRHQELREERQSMLEKRVMGQAYESASVRRLGEIYYAKHEDPVLGPDGVQIWPLQ